jgi:hypothetical protein
MDGQLHICGRRRARVNFPVYGLRHTPIGALECLSDPLRERGARWLPHTALRRLDCTPTIRRLARASPRAPARPSSTLGTSRITSVFVAKLRAFHFRPPGRRVANRRFSVALLRPAGKELSRKTCAGPTHDTTQTGPISALNVCACSSTSRIASSCFTGGYLYLRRIRCTIRRSLARPLSSTVAVG